MKKTWISPELTVHGNVEKITQQDKTFGATDGLTFQGVPIRNNS
jgi:hypothetical protein